MIIGQTKRICVITLASIWCLTIIGGSFLSVNAQRPDSNRLPILLIHGYAEDSSIWISWEDWLAANHFSKVYPITFHLDELDDKCGSVEQHATELKSIVDKILRDTGYEKVNIVAHSKGGLDARWYIAHSGITDKVANLIMIGTPNAGSPAAFVDLTGCPPGSDRDLFPWSQAPHVRDRPENTKYYTIAGNWLPNNVACMGLDDGGNCFIPGYDDGFVAVNSVESSRNYIALGEPVPYYHLDLLAHRDVYERALPILGG
jgi:pimeloyl-ACP methyl ester carboxylesterase